jgi:hypothetical protein
VWDWFGATPLRSAAVVGAIGGVVFFLLSLVIYADSSIVGTVVLSVIVAVVLCWSFSRTTRKAYPGAESTWASLPGPGKGAVAHAIRTGEVQDDPQVATAVLERIEAVRATGKPIGTRFAPRLERAETAAKQILESTG